MAGQHDCVTWIRVMRWWWEEEWWGFSRLSKQWTVVMFACSSLEKWWPQLIIGCFGMESWGGWMTVVLPSVLGNGRICMMSELKLEKCKLRTGISLKQLMGKRVSDCTREFPWAEWKDLVVGSDMCSDEESWWSGEDVRACLLPVRNPYDPFNDLENFIDVMIVVFCFFVFSNKPTNWRKVFFFLWVFCGNKQVKTKIMLGIWSVAKKSCFLSFHQVRIFLWQKKKQMVLPNNKCQESAPFSFFFDHFGWNLRFFQLFCWAKSSFGAEISSQIHTFLFSLINGLTEFLSFLWIGWTAFWEKEYTLTHMIFENNFLSLETNVQEGFGRTAFHLWGSSGANCWQKHSMFSSKGSSSRYVRIFLLQQSFSPNKTKLKETQSNTIQSTTKKRRVFFSCICDWVQKKQLLLFYPKEFGNQLSLWQFLSPKQVEDVIFWSQGQALVWLSPLQFQRPFKNVQTKQSTRSWLWAEPSPIPKHRFQHMTFVMFMSNIFSRTKLRRNNWLIFCFAFSQVKRFARIGQLPRTLKSHVVITLLILADDKFKSQQQQTGKCVLLAQHWLSSTPNTRSKMRFASWMSLFKFTRPKFEWDDKVGPVSLFECCCTESAAFWKSHKKLKKSQKKVFFLWTKTLLPFYWSAAEQKLKLNKIS